MKAILIIAYTALFLTGCKRDITPPDVDSSGTEGTSMGIYWPEDVSSIEIPIEYEAELAYVRCQINGKQSTLLLDTGCGSLALYQDSLARLGLDVVPGESTATVGTAAGPIKAVYCKPFKMAIADGLYVNVSQAYVLPPRFKKGYCEGVLGLAILRGLSGVLDLGNAKLILEVNREAAQQPPVGDALKAASEESR